MKLVRRVCYIFLFSIFILLIFQAKVEANYSIDKMNIEATVLENGDINVKQRITYTFKSNYNGIYIKIPYMLSDLEKDEAVKDGKINDKLYTRK